MSTTLSVYAFEDADGREQDWTTTDYGEACEHAASHGLKLIEREFVYHDLNLLEDFTPERVFDAVRTRTTVEVGRAKVNARTLEEAQEKADDLAEDEFDWDGGSCRDDEIEVTEA